MDIQWGFNNIRIKEGDEWKAAFITNRGLFEPTVMFFGLCNSPATFQTMMNEPMRELINENKALVYMDNIMTPSMDLPTQIQVNKRILQICRENKIYLNPDKCLFHQEKVQYLGMVISQNKVEMDPVKVQGVTKWPAPKTVKQVRAFLGFTGYYRCFIKDYAKIAQPLHDLTKKLDTNGQKDSRKALMN